MSHPDGEKGVGREQQIGEPFRRERPGRAAPIVSDFAWKPRLYQEQGLEEALCRVGREIERNARD